MRTVHPLKQLSADLPHRNSSKETALEILRAEHVELPNGSLVQAGRL
jgi:hypothetical protein